MAKQTPNEKEYKRALEDWKCARNRAASKWSFGKIKTYGDLLHEALGQDKESLLTYYPTEQFNAVVTHKQVIDFFNPFRDTIDWQYAQFNGSAWQCPSPAEHDYEGCIYKPRTEVSITNSVSNTEPEQETGLDIGLTTSTKQKCFLFPFQERAAIQLLDGILVKRRRGQLLRAAVGTGKTYIVGAVARRLLDIDFCKDKTFSPWAICWITRASIVEQTKRVLEEQFSIDTVNELQVINVEQLRSSFGELMVRAETIIERGEEHTVWKWRPNVHPLIFFIDESQFAKNEDSTQSKIIQAISELDNPNIYVICFSATPLLRVLDAKYLVLNMRLQTKGMSHNVNQ